MLESNAVIARLRAAHAQGASRQALLEESARLIRAAGAPYTSVYLYMLHGDELVLEAHDGRPTEHVRIPVGRGVCGTAVAERRDQNVPDVTAAGNYLACNLETRSELVVLIERDGVILGQIDVDSDVPAGFTEAEHAAARRVADALAQLL
jgi:GAF domain-containing protein